MLFVLDVAEAAVDAAMGVELLMGATLFDDTVVEDEDAIGTANGGEAVGDGEDGAVLHQVVDRALHLLLGDGVEGAGGFVEDEDGRIAQDGAGDGDALALAAAEDEALFADHTFVPFGVRHDEIVGVRQFGGLDDLFAGGVGGAVGDVGGDGVVEEDGFLSDGSDDGADVGDFVVPDVVAIDEDLAGGDIVEAGEEVGDGALATAG